MHALNSAPIYSDNRGVLEVDGGPGRIRTGDLLHVKQMS